MSTHDVIAETRRTLAVLEHARLHDLPMPFDVTTTTHSAPTLMFRTLADLTAWALWMDQPISEDPTPSGTVHYAAAGELLEHDVRLTHVGAAE